ncbi:MAG TPA: hypothetical protein VJB70_01020 [Candidatus Paceibacterota bacterium]
MHRLHTPPYLFLLSFLGLVLFLFAGMPGESRALILDGGVAVPENMSSQSVTGIDSLIQQSGPATVRDTITAGGPNGAILLGDLINQVGVTHVAGALRQTTGTNLGTTLRGSGVSNSAGVIRQTSGESYGTLLGKTRPGEINNIFGQTSGTPLGQVMRQTGAGPVAETINASNGTLFGRTLDRTGASTVGNVIQGRGGAKTGSALLSLGDSTGNISTIAGAGNEQNFLLALSDGPLQQSVSTVGNGSFDTFVSNVGPQAAAQSIASGIAGVGGSANKLGIENELAGLFGTSNFLNNSNSSGDYCGLGSGSSGISAILNNPEVQNQLKNAVGEGASQVLEEAGLGGLEGLLGIGGGGSFVPVKDADVIKITTAIAGDTKVMRSYLKDLCAKEFKLDPEEQHKWIQVSENLVRHTLVFMNTAYANNPIFISNPYAYFDKVSNGVFQTLAEEIRTMPAGTIDTKTHYELLQLVERLREQYLFPTLVQSDTIDLNALRNNFNEGGSWETFHNLLINPVNNPQGLTELLRGEVDKRLAQARSIEEQKLAWGEGFFSYEVCDEQLYQQNLLGIDRRNCRIITPGSLIKDQISLVLGTAIRQIENADEYDERISQAAYTALNNVLGTTGVAFRKNPSAAQISGGAVSPEDVRTPQGTSRSQFNYPSAFWGNVDGRPILPGTQIRDAVEQF